MCTFYRLNCIYLNKQLVLSVNAFRTYIGAHGERKTTIRRNIEKKVVTTHMRFNAESANHSAKVILQKCALLNELLAAAVAAATLHISSSNTLKYKLYSLDDEHFYYFSHFYGDRMKPSRISYHFNK